MKIKIRIAVEVDGAEAPWPAALAWDYEKSAGDNPSYYGHELQLAIREAADGAVEGAQPYVRRRSPTDPE